MVPGLTTAAQYAGSPLPLPMRVSAGMAVTDFCGNTRMYSRPSPRTECAAVMRPASMASALSQPPSRACSPNSPNVTRLPRLALPFTLPRWLFRNFTRLGMSGIGRLLGVQIVPVVDPHLDADVALGGLDLDVAVGQGLQLARELIDLLALLADDDADAGRVDVDHDLLARALDLDARDARVPVALLDVAPDLHVLDQQLGEVLLVGVPAAQPIDHDPRAEPGRPYFLPHDPAFLSSAKPRFPDRRAAVVRPPRGSSC